VFRIAFDPNLPVVASQPFEAKGERFAAGSAVDWKRLGISEFVLRDWYRACLISHPVEANTTPVSVGPQTAAKAPSPPAKRSQRSR